MLVIIFNTLVSLFVGLADFRETRMLLRNYAKFCLRKSLFTVKYGSSNKETETIDISASFDS